MENENSCMMQYHKALSNVKWKPQFESVNNTPLDMTMLSSLSGWIHKEFIVNTPEKMNIWFTGIKIGYATWNNFLNNGVAI